MTQTHLLAQPAPAGLASPPQAERSVYPLLFRISLTLITLVRIAFLVNPANCLATEEAHYWEWSRQLDWAYYSKPPMIAWMIRLSTTLFGQTATAVRMPALLTSLVIALATWKLVRRMTRSAAVAFWSVLLLNVLPLYDAGAILMTTDTPLMLFWVLATYCFYRYLFEGARAMALWGGLFLGLGLMSKLTILFLLVGILGFMAFSRFRSRLRSRELWAGLALAALMLVPVILWNWKHNWVSFRHLAGQAGAYQGSKFTPGYALTFLASQAGVLTPVVFLLFLWTPFRAWKIRGRDTETDLRLAYLLWIALPVFLIYLAKSLHYKVQTNWAVSGYYTWSIAAVIVGRQFMEGLKTPRAIIGARLTAAAASVPAALLTLVMHDTTLLDKVGIHIKPKNDPTKEVIGWKGLGQQVSRVRASMPNPADTFVMGETYHIAAELAFYVDGQPRTYCADFGRRMNQYDLWGGHSELKGKDAVFVHDSGKAEIPAQLLALFDKVEPAETYRAVRNGKSYGKLQIHRCHGYKPQTVNGKGGLLEKEKY